MNIDENEESIVIRYYIDLSKEMDEFMRLQLDLIEKHGNEPREDALDCYQVSIMSPTGAHLLQGAEDGDDDFEEEKQDYTYSIDTLFSLTDDGEWLSYEIGGEVFREEISDIEGGSGLAAQVRERNQKLLGTGRWEVDPVTGMLVSRMERIFAEIAELSERLDAGFADDKDVQRWINNHVDYALVREGWHVIGEKPHKMEFVIQLYEGPCISGWVPGGAFSRSESLSVYREPLGTSSNERWHISDKAARGLKRFVRRLNRCDVWKNINPVPHVLVDGACLGRDQK